MIACALAALGLGTVYARCAAVAGQGFGAELRKAEYQKIQEFSFANTDHFQTASLVTRLTGDITILQNVICNGLRPLIRGPTMMVTAFFMACLLNGKLAAIFLIAIPLLAVCLFFYSAKAAPPLR